MSEQPEIRFVAQSATASSTVVCLLGRDQALGEQAGRIDKRSGGALKRALAAANFQGKTRSSLEILGAAGLDNGRVILVGAGDATGASELDWTRLGGVIYRQVAQRTTPAASVLIEGVGVHEGEVAAWIAEGVLLAAYTFTKYRTRRGEENGDNGASQKAVTRIDIHCADPAAAEAAFEARRAVTEGVYLARDLVNEPANALGPVEFADRLARLAIPGLEVEVLGLDELKALGMGALMAVGQGSVREARVVVMQWHGAKKARAKQQPLCFVGKGVCFDTGGISMKPAAGMEDMKGDMGGAACVSGLMLALARRKAPVNAVGIVGLVENMPSGNATRPGDIVTSMSGQTIEVLNTDAEGRLVLADLLWYIQDRFKPRFIIDLATLTGAIMVALGKEHAGLFANNDKLARELAEAGTVTGEKVWRMPLAPAYDKLIDSKTADMKNIGGRFGGAITAAQFLQRFIRSGDTPWAHLDVAGVAMDSGRTEINQSWGSGWGVRMLDHLVAASYE
ncbi:MAG: leucyl aminopeptidase [Hyphomicrobiaceae bacterium]